MGQQFNLEEDEVLSSEEIDGIGSEEEIDDSEFDYEIAGENVADDPNLIPITYKDENGEDVEAYVTEEELSKLLDGNSGGEAKGDISQEMKRFVEQTAPLIDIYNSSEIMRNIHYYRQQGYSDEQIKRGLVQLWSEEIATSEQQQQQGMDTEDTNVHKLVEQKLMPVQKELQTLRYQQAVKDAYANNSAVLSSKLAEYGWTDKLDEKQIQAMADVLNTIYKDKDKYTLMLTEKDADIIVRATLGRNNKNGSGKSDAVKLGRQVSAPTILPGKGGKRIVGKSPRGEQKMENVTLEERLQRKKDFFS